MAKANLTLRNRT